jgi:hypothetical protein
MTEFIERQRQYAGGNTGSTGGHDTGCIFDANSVEQLSQFRYWLQALPTVRNQASVM